MELKLGRIYRDMETNTLVRLVSFGGAGFCTGRGCTPKTATPLTHIRESNLDGVTIDEINYFLENELKNGMVSVINAPILHPKGLWVEEVSSGYNGYRCRRCATWVYADRERRCHCDCPIVP